MIFVYKKWDDFCKKLYDNNIISIPACKVDKEKNGFLVLKHDVETDVKKAYTLAKIENKYGHKGSYYVQAYLMEDSNNIEMLKKMQDMGHEISYHYDVMDSNKGNIEKAFAEFEIKKQIFEKNGFTLKTVCQHGNPIVNRVGYSSNRDFFRNDKIKEKLPTISDIMVNFKEQKLVDYTYYSDVGRKFKMIFDPINNDIINSDDKNISYEDLDEVFGKIIKSDENIIISTHPHRWEKSETVYRLKAFRFLVIKKTAKILMKIPIIKKLMDRYYYLAKKI